MDNEMPSLNTTVHDVHHNSSNQSLKKPHRFNDDRQKMLFSATAVGALLGLLPIAHLTTHYGTRMTFTIYGMVSAISTLLTPLCVNLGFFPLLAMRILQGFATGSCFPAMGAVMSAWAPLRSSGMYMCFLTCHMQFGPMFTMPIAGMLCNSSWTWRGTYYVQGLVTFALFVAFYLFYQDSASSHRNVSAQELWKIQKGKILATEKRKVPYVQMASDMAVWGVIISTFSVLIGLQIFLQYGPIYFSEVLKFDVENTGVSVALPHIVAVVVKFLIGPMSDFMTCINEKWRVIFFTSLSQGLMLVSFGALAFLPPSQLMLIQAAFSGLIVFSGINAVGVFKSTQLMSGPFSYVLMTINALTNSIVILVLPLLVGWLAPHNLTFEWERIFLGVAIFLALCTIVFYLTVEVDPRPWTQLPGVTNDAPVAHTNVAMVLSDADLFPDKLDK
jgi:ACS family sodium-dependent inorganic phosphate cotransporter-like MFS transporter 5